MKGMYGDLFSPVNVNGVMLRNRIISTASCPHFVQGPENFPTEGLIHYHGLRAKGGAAVVVCKANQPKKVIDPHDMNTDITNEACLHYFAQMTDAIHYYGAKASLLVQPDIKLTEGWDASDGILSEFVEGDGSVPIAGKMAPPKLLETIADSYAEHAYQGKRAGFDMCFIHMAYRLMFPGRFISPYSNRRTDEFGGSVANRARFPLMICKKIKERCGEDFLIEISCSGHEPELTPGVRIEDTIQLAKEIEDVVDILQIRGTFIDPSQPTYINTDRIIHRKTAAAITEGVRSMGCKTKITLVGGCSVPELLDEIVRNGEADFIGMARGLIADANFPQKSMEDHSDEIVPCLRCNKCHQAKLDDWNSVCSVNPEFGIEHRRLHMSVPPSTPKKVAVIGGGPAGMKTAIDAASRGHRVTIFEQGDRLGGLLNNASIPAIKWTLKEFRDYLIHMVEKNPDIEVKLGVKATPEMVETGDFDAVVSAIGAEPIFPDIPGINLPHVITALESLHDESKLAKEIVIVGGGEIGVETGIHLAENGHHVTVLEMLDELAPDSVPIHFRSLLRQKWESTEGFNFRIHAHVIAIDADGVTYVDENCAEYTVPAGSVVISAGLKSKTEEAYGFYGSAKKSYIIGDCYKPGSVQQAMRNGYATARMI
jgi:2,4-dienoyl-CoA reductase-like NADH-dependent reductase (Old Yellow Enzyme family)/thioredoxin reductase